jgi:hypothetical protein
MPRCIRCGVVVNSVCIEDVGEWKLIECMPQERGKVVRMKDCTDTTKLMDDTGKWIGLCPDCQIKNAYECSIRVRAENPEEAKKKIMSGKVEEQEIVCFVRYG